MNINLDLQDFLPTDTEAHTDCGSSEEIVETSFRNSSIFFGEASDSCEKVWSEGVPNVDRVCTQWSRHLERRDSAR